MNDGFGGDTLIQRNLLFASLLETSDHGPYNSWDRLPFLYGSRVIICAKTQGRCDEGGAAEHPHQWN